MNLPVCFNLADDAAYRLWREQKLDIAPRKLADIVVQIDDPRSLHSDERQHLLALAQRCNMAIYAGNTGTDPDKEIPRKLGTQLGLNSIDNHWLTDDDAISPISVQTTSEAGARKDFIPYTDKPIKWHTDGYYNAPECTIRGLLLHCVQNAATGGENQLLDPEIAYILLRDENPEFIRVLSKTDAMTIPPRSGENEIARAARPGPVFSVDAAGYLHMRYTARKVSILWHNDPLTRAAVAALARYLATPTPWTLNGKLEPGMGLVCNNVLHDRSAFTETTGQRRLLYRARYYERLAAS